MRPALVVCAAIAVVLPLSEARAQDLAPLTGYRVTAWMEEDGLPAGPIWALAQDADGFLWIGSDAGLIRFDGARFRTWPELGGEPLPAESVHAMVAAADEGLWVGFGDRPAIARIRGHGVTTYGPADGVTGAQITALVETPSGTVWAGTTNGLLKLQGRRWISAGDALRGGVVSLAVGPAGDLYVATKTALFTQAPGDADFTQVASTSAVFQALAVDTSNRVWVTDRNVGYREIGTDSAALARAREPRGKGYRLLPDGKGNLWIATYGQGVWQVRLTANGETTSVRSVTDFQGLSNNVIYALLEDRGGNIWAGTTAGLNRLAPQRVTQVQDLGIVTGLEVTSPETVWANTADGLTPFVLRGGQWRQDEYRGPRIYTEVMHADSSGALWAADGSGVQRLTDSGGTISHARVSTELRQVKSITSSPDGSVWMWDSERGLYHWKHGALVAVPLPAPARNRRISSIFADRTGRVWMAGQSTAGALLSIAADGSVSMYGLASGFAAGTPRMFLEDGDGTLWIAGSLGLSRFADGRFATLKRDSHLPLDSLTGVIEDSLGRLWIGTAAGIVRITKADFDAAVAGRWDDVSADTFDSADGVAGTTGWIGQPSVIRSGDGRLWFLTVTGVSIVDPRSMQDTTPQAPVRIDVVSIDDQQRLPALDATAVGPKATRLRVEFTVPNLSPAQDTRFRYQLEGFDTEWINAGRVRTATYTNLPPREYRFRVQLQSPNGSWEASTASWAFSVRPAFYQTTWFLAFCAALLLALAWSAWRLRVRQVRRQLAIVHGERARLSREIHDTLLQSLAGVALQCDALANAPDHESAIKGLTTLRRQVEGYVRECRQSLWNLRSPMLEERDLTSALRHVAERTTQTGGMALEMEVSGPARPLPGRIDEQLLRIGQEAITNAVRHSRATLVKVRLAYAATRVTLTITDNGAGFDPDAATHAERGHWGLVGMQERATAVNGQIAITSRASGGTDIVVSVPLPDQPPIHAQGTDHRALHRRSSDRAGGDRADRQPAA